MKTIYKGLLLQRCDNEKLGISKISIKRKNALKELYSLLKCNIIDIQERKINGKTYDIIFDDEYLINGKTEKAENITAFAMFENKIAEVIYGNIFICGKADENGAETDLNESDITNILKSIVYISHKPTNKKYETLKYDF